MLTCSHTYLKTQYFPMKTLALDIEDVSSARGRMTSSAFSYKGISITMFISVLLEFSRVRTFRVFFSLLACAA